MDNLQANDFITVDLMSLWPNWKNVSAFELKMWVKIFRPYSYEKSVACLEKYFNSPDYTIQKPKPASILRHMGCSAEGGKDKNFVWIQNTDTGVFYPLYFSAELNSDKVLVEWFKKHHPDGEWKVYLPAEKTNSELLKFKIECDKRKPAVHIKGGIGDEVDEFCKKYDIVPEAAHATEHKLDDDIPF